MPDVLEDVTEIARRERAREDLESRLKAATGLELRNGQGNLDNLAGDKLERFVKWCGRRSSTSGTGKPTSTRTSPNRLEKKRMSEKAFEERGRTSVRPRCSSEQHSADAWVLSSTVGRTPASLRRRLRRISGQRCALRAFPEVDNRARVEDQLANKRPLLADHAELHRPTEAASTEPIAAG